MKWADLTSAVLLGLIRGYKRTLSPILARMGVRCRFYPSCSEYAVLAIRKHGPYRGALAAVKRIARCRPDNYDSCIDYP